MKEIKKKVKRKSPSKLPVAKEGKKMVGKQVKRPLAVVGIGSSAGGLSALEQFFLNIRSNTGLAFVVVSHLNPTQKSMLKELLQRCCTNMNVIEAKEGMEVLPNHVYIIPPNKDLSIFKSKLYLSAPVKPRGLRLPIDFFFRSLAEDQKERAIGVILSGMGSDGTLGIRALKGKMGMTMAQEPETAEYDSMPRSAINTGLVDFVSPVEELPSKLLNYIRHPSYSKLVNAKVLEGKDSEMQQIFDLLRKQLGHDFSMYKKSTVYRRLERRMSIHLINEIPVYVRYLSENPQEVEMLFKEFLIGVTCFFRDAEAFELLKKEFIPELLKNKSNGDFFRVWIAGCSSGEEAYSIAMIIKECWDDLPELQNLQIQIFASDIDQGAIDKARSGLYPDNIALDVSAERLNRFFIKTAAGYQIQNDIRHLVVFAQQNIIHDPPFTNLDMICCRNLLIYLSSEIQKKLIPLFHYSLKPNGILFLGSSETIGSYIDLFSSLDAKWKIFQRKPSASSYNRLLDFPFSHLTFDNRQMQQISAKNNPDKETSISQVVQKILLNDYVPPSVIINSQGNILYINGKTGKYIELASGQPHMNIFEMSTQELKFEISAAIREASSKKKAVTYENIKVEKNGVTQSINLTVKPFNEPESMRGLMMIMFEDANPAKASIVDKVKKTGSAKNSKVQQLEKELKYSKERLQTIVEEMENTVEELRSSNEELQSTNEELQSSNEELMTSKEELQSLNEELINVNLDLESKIDELSQANNDIKNLLDNTEIATIFLDRSLRIMRFTFPVKKLINLIETDIGRPITHIVSNLKYEDLAEDVSEVLKTLTVKEKQVETKDGTWYSMKILPYKTNEMTIEGVVVTFTDIMQIKKMEALQTLYSVSKNIVETLREPLVVLDQDLRIVSANKAFFEIFHLKSERTKGELIFEVGQGQWNVPRLKKLLKNILPKQEEFNDFLIEENFPGIGNKKLLLNARPINNEGNGINLIFLAIEDVTNNQ